MDINFRYRRQAFVKYSPFSFNVFVVIFPVADWDLRDNDPWTHDWTTFGSFNRFMCANIPFSSSFFNFRNLHVKFRWGFLFPNRLQFCRFWFHSKIQMNLERKITELKSQFFFNQAKLRNKKWSHARHVSLFSLSFLVSGGQKIKFFTNAKLRVRLKSLLKAPHSMSLHCFLFFFDPFEKIGVNHHQIIIKSVNVVSPPSRKWFSRKNSPR